MGNRIRRLITLAVIGALLIPVVIDRDSFPLSTYPMYSRQRGDTVLFHTAVGVADSGERLSLGLEIIGLSDDPLIVASLVRQTVRLGGDALDRFCTDVAARVDDDSPDQYRSIEVVAERHDVVARAQGEPSLLDRDVLVTCPVDSAS